MVTICTMSHLHRARTLVTSFLASHPAVPSFVVITDWDGRAEVPISEATPIAGEHLGVPRFDFLALKYSALDLCCTLKPFAISHLLEAGFTRVVYLDSDVYVFAPLVRLFSGLDTHDVVVTPHVLGPPPPTQRFWERPTLGDLAYAGVLNAGMFAIRASADARRALAIWQDLVVRPGAFLPSLGGQMEQNSFNWVACWAESVLVIRDAAYNVAYWNLYERSVRWSALDQPEAAASWTVNGEPLVAFHFSGFSLREPYRLSGFDDRHIVYLLPSLAGLLEFYAHELRRNGGDKVAEGYRFGQFPSGIPIDEGMRLVVKEHEALLECEHSPWTAQGEAHYCEALLSPVPYTGSLVPILFERIRAARPDLQRAFPEAPLRPQGFFRWIAAHGIAEYHYEQLFDRHRPTLPTAAGVAALCAAEQRHAGLLTDLSRPLTVDRPRFLTSLRAAGESALANAVGAADGEHYFVSMVALLRSVFEERPDVQHAFPDPLFSDAQGFAAWLLHDGVRDHFLPPHAVQSFTARANGLAIARVFSYVNRNWDFMRRWPLAFVGEGREELARALLTPLRDGLEYDLDDVLMYLWAMDTTPWVGVALTLELALNALREPSPLTREGQEGLLGPVLARDSRFGRALEQHRRSHPTPPGVNFAVRASPEVREITVSSHLAAANGGERRPRRRVATQQPLFPGVNLFGYHKSPIGLGNLSRGIGSALEHSGIPVRPIVVGNVAMDADLSPSDFIRRYDHSLDTNLFVSYSHLQEMLLHVVPRRDVECRRNIAYLAWEQRDGTSLWERVYGDFDQIWALSDFSASCFRRFMRTDILTVPAVLDFPSFPPPASKRAVGVDPERFTFLYVFDANSSVERKNPDAVASAFCRAFRYDENAELVLKISNADRLEHRQRLRSILSRVSPRANIRVLSERLSSNDVLRLISAADCYVSLHRAEGFGYTCAEAMAYGKPVIATGYSGNLQFMQPSNSYLVEYREVEVAVADGPFQRGSVWAEPDIGHAAALMREVYEHRSAALERGAAGQRSVRSSLSRSSVGRIASMALGAATTEESTDDLLCAEP